ncbi:MAG: HAD family hydrolase [Sulfuricurvum sp.]|uniref:HAD family hydrolase n=1 Tax=Sulfuricurvum sp. TaxID=2025608 RepID=UPI0026033D1E|nr:HAD family hydrolase [Sulfuricurvum sp.]MDD2784298.1 HAD family hydrolase [Sulfuricurvum sp.]
MQRIAIFDMDGTLIDSGLDITVSINYVRSQCYSLKPLSVQEVVDAINAPKRNLSEIFYEKETYEQCARDLFEEHYFEQCIQNVVAYEGVHDVLKTLHDHGVAMGVATNAPSIFAKRMLKHLELDIFFTNIIGADNVESPKPHPQMLNHHLNHFRYRPGTDNAWIVGDNSKDIEAASRAGIRSIFAAWGFSTDGNGDYFASTPDSLFKIICEKG